MFFIAISAIIHSQAPKEINYQGVARNVSGAVIPNQQIGLELKLHQGTSGGPVNFVEVHSKTTNNLGLFTLAIGSVNMLSFSAINWGSGPYFLEVSIDPAGGTNYITVGSQQLLSVPYALYAATSGNAASTPTINGFGIAVVNSPAQNIYNINVPPPSLNYNNASNVLSLTQGSVVSTQTLTGIGASTINVIGVGMANVNPTSGTSFTVNVPNPIFSPSTGVLSFGAANVNVNPTLSLAGNILSSGPASNSVTLSQGAVGSGTINTVPLWTGTTTLGNSVITQNVGGGIVMSDPTTGAAAPRLRVKSNDYSVFAEDMSGIHTFGVRSEIGPPNDDGVFVGTINSDLHFMTGNNINPNTMVLKKNSNRLGIGTKIPASKIHINGNAQVDSSLIFGMQFVQPALSGALQGKLYLSASGFFASVNGASYVPLYVPDPWVEGVSTITTSISNQRVGIGLFIPTSPLHVRNFNSTVTAVPVANIENTNPSFNASAVLQVSKTTGIGDIINANNSANSGRGITVTLSDIGNTNTAVNINHSGIGTGLVVSQTGSGIGIDVTTTANKYALVAANNSNSFPTIFAQNSGSHDAFRALAGQGRGLYTESSSGAMSTIETTNLGGGLAFLAYKGIGKFGNVANFAIAESTNGGDVVYINNDGTGAALRTISGSTSALGLWVQNGHMKGSGLQCAVNAVTTTFASLTLPSYTFSGTYNDIKGRVQVSFPLSTIASGQFLLIKVAFVKPYSSGTPPIVVITPIQTDLNFQLNSVSTTDFEIIFKNYTGGPISTSSFAFNYFVIE